MFSLAYGIIWWLYTDNFKWYFSKSIIIVFENEIISLYICLLSRLFYTGNQESYEKNYVRNDWEVTWGPPGLLLMLDFCWAL